MPVLGYSWVLNTLGREWACVTMKHRYHQVVVASYTESQEWLCPAKPHSQPRILNVGEVTAKAGGGLHALSLAELPVAGWCPNVCCPTQRPDQRGQTSPASFTVPRSVRLARRPPLRAVLPPPWRRIPTCSGVANRRSKPSPAGPHPTTLTAKLQLWRTWPEFSSPTSWGQGTRWDTHEATGEGGAASSFRIWRNQSSTTARAAEGNGFCVTLGN